MRRSWLIFILCAVAIAQNIDYNTQLKNKPSLVINVADAPYKAKCDGGMTNDRAAIQAAIDAVGSGTLTFPSPTTALPNRTCGVGSPGLYLYPANWGITINGTGSLNAGAGSYVPGKGGGLVAYAADPPVTVLSIYAEYTKLNNLYIDGNNGSSAHGIVCSLCIGLAATNVVVNHHSSDGFQFDTNANFQSAVTAGGTIGSTAVTLNPVSSNRLVYAQYYSSQIIFGVGGANLEQHTVISVVGNVVNFVGALAHNQTTANMAMNNDNALLRNLVADANGGWGLNVLTSSDNNRIINDQPELRNNTLGGVKWTGSVNSNIGGGYEGNSGPAIQLGDTSGGRTDGIIVTTPHDLENTNVIYNSVWSVCDDVGTVFFRVATDLKIFTANADICPLYYTGHGSTTVGFGQDGNQCFAVVTSLGTSKYGFGCAVSGTGTKTITNYFVPTEDGANNAISGNVLDSNGNPVAYDPAKPFNVTIVLAHTLAANPTTITFQLNRSTGTPDAVRVIGDCNNPTVFPLITHPVGSVVTLFPNIAGNWCMF